MTCLICNGSGERDGEYGLLSCDAPNCTAATERAALEAANKAAEPMTVYDQRWFSYQAGKAAAKAEMQVVAYAVASERGGIHKLSITEGAANRKATTWRLEWPNNNCRVRPLVFGDS